MGDIIHRAKQLYLEVKENETRYVNEELNISDVLHKTDSLFTDLSTERNSVANEYLQDSDLLAVEAKIIRQNARSYKIHALSFDPRYFSIKTRNHFGLGNSDETLETSRRDPLVTLWNKLGEWSKEIMNTVPNFNYIYGTFDADPVEPVKKKRKKSIKDKVGDVTKPKEVSLNEVNDGQDKMCDDASRVLTCFMKHAPKSESRTVCFYEFVIDPESFTRTIENVFLVSLLVQNGDLCIVSDNQGLPCIEKVQSKDSEVWSSTAKQTVLSIDLDEWKSLKKTFKLKTPLIPPRTTN